MTKVRIGNDIRLNVTLRGTLDFDLANIKQIKCYFINTLIDDQLVPPYDTKRTFDRLSDPDTKVMDIDGMWYSVGELDPYPIDDLGIEWPLHEPSPYHFDICGPHGYHFGPWNAWHEHPHHHHDPFAWHPRERWHLFDRRLRCEHHMPPHYGEWRERHERMPILSKDPCYLAPCRILDEKNRIQVYFPAEELVFCGNYKLVIELTTYEPGWGPKNLRLRTIEMPDVFAIVDNSTGIDQDVELELNEDGRPYTCAVAAIPVLPPGVTFDNANTTDQSFEEENHVEASGIIALPKYLKYFQKKDIITKSLEFTADVKDNGFQNFIWILSERPIYYITLNDSNLATPITKVGENDSNYCYAIPNAIQNVGQLKVTVYFEKTTAVRDFLGLMNPNSGAVDECDCERIPDNVLQSILG